MYNHKVHLKGHAKLENSKGVCSKRVHHVIDLSTTLVSVNAQYCLQSVVDLLAVYE